MILRVTLLAAVLSAGCGGLTDMPFPDSGPPDGDKTDSSPLPDSGPLPGCPSSLPSSGSACVTLGITCEYGGDVRWTCNTVATCSGGAWSLSETKDPSCPTVNASACPPSESDIQPSAACSNRGLSCNYSTMATTSFCNCMDPGGPIQIDGGGAQWLCTNQFVGGCPAVRPRLGTSCSQPELQCDYGICGMPTGLGVQCNGATGTWTLGPGSVCAGANGG